MWSALESQSKASCDKKAKTKGYRLIEELKRYHQDQRLDQGGSATTDAETGHVSDVSVAVARHARFRRCVVFATMSGKSSRHVSCFKLDNCNDVRSLDPDAAIARGLRQYRKNTKPATSVLDDAHVAGMS